MRLFKMEIYKLYHEKVFLWGVLFCNRVNDDIFLVRRSWG